MRGGIYTLEEVNSLSYAPGQPSVDSWGADSCYIWKARG